MACLRASCCALLCLTAVTVRATPVTWGFTATVEFTSNSSGGIAPGVSPGMAVSGFMTFDGDAPNTDPPGSTRGFYEGAILRTALTIGDWTAVQQAPEENFLTDLALVTNYPGQHASFMQSAPIDLTQHFSNLSMVIEMSSSANLWPNQALLLTPPSLSQLDPYGANPNSPWGYGTDLYIFGYNASGAGTEIRAQFDSLVRLVSEPELPLGTTGDSDIFHGVANPPPGGGGNPGNPGDPGNPGGTTDPGNPGSGNPPPGSGGSIPEPSPFALLALGLTVGGLLRSR